MQIRSLGWEDPLEKGMAAHSSILVWRIPWTGEPGGLQSIGVRFEKFLLALLSLTLLTALRDPVASEWLSEDDQGCVALSLCPGNIWRPLSVPIRENDFGGLPGKHLQ